MKVLIADNSQPVCARLERLLSEFLEVDQIAEVNDLQSALLFSQRLRPDVVIIDPWRLDADDAAVLAQIKKEQPAPVVIVWTECPAPRYLAACRHAGADFLFNKATEFMKVGQVMRLLTRKSLAAAAGAAAGANDIVLRALLPPRQRGFVFGESP